MRRPSIVGAGTIASVIIPGDVVSIVGQVLTFSLKGIFLPLFQDPFQVTVVRFDALERIIAVRTVNPGHPLFGWRFWKVYPSANGVTVETGAYDRPAAGVLNALGFVLARKEQTDTWKELLQYIVAAVDGSVQSAPELLEGVWNVDSVAPPVSPLIPQAGRHYIMTQVCGYLSLLPMIELMGACQ